MRLASIHTYPVKGLHRIDRDAARVQPWGLAGDRRYLLIDGDGRMLTQRQEPRLTQLRPSYVDGRLVVRTVGRSDLDVAPAPGELIEVEVWRTRVLASLVGEVADRWLSEALDRKVRLVYLDDPTRRPVDPDYGTAADRVSFADGYPLLLTNSASLDVLNDWIAESGSDEGPLPMTRFRPNVVVAGARAWAEDGWVGRRLRIGGVGFRMPKACGRCVVPTTDQETGVRGREPSRTLARHRTVDQKLLFGINLIPDGTGEIRVGDEIALLD
ncbi:MAG: MOSC domain-containing protein [Actinobacteria bacterium]|nr:MAG: MOSC domain-containing protein [Actinomycetota bacterium]